MHLPIGKLYKKIMLNDPERKRYGFIPLMASCSRGELGALNAESFSERMLSCANDVMDEGNTLLSDAEVEMLVLLRMNREFMEYMRENYNHISKEQFGITVVRSRDVKV